MEKTIKQKKWLNRKTIFIILTIAPTFLHLLIFWFGVQVESFIMAFTDYETGKFTLLGNFEWFFRNLTVSDGELPQAFANTFKFFFMSIAIIPLQIFAAYMMYKKMFGSKFIRLALYLPGAIGGIMMALLFQQLMQSEGPLIYLFNEVLGFNISTPVITEHALAMIMIYDLWIGLGGGMIIWLGAMSRIPPDIIEYGKLDGVGAVREFMSIILPLIWPTVVTILTFSLMGIFGASGSVLVFTEGQYGTMTFSYWQYHVVYKNQANLLNYSVASGFLVAFATIPIVIFGRIFMNRFGGEVEY